MAERRIFSCDVCGAEQAATNHWFIALIDKTPKLVLVPLGPVEQGGAELFHLCGEQCVSKKVSEFVGARSNGKATQ